jgi:4'-phosphopantetheinyl transferase EntD
VVAVTRSTEIAGVGIDIEEDTPLQAELIPMVCTPEERLWVDGFEPASRRELAKIIFSAKEAFYKCQYAITRAQLDFHDVHLRIDLAGGLFSVARITHEGAQWDRIRSATGKFRRESGFVLSTSTLLTLNVHASP